MTPLRRRMTEDMQVRNFSPHTQNSYVRQVSLFARYFSKSPELLGPEEIRSYQVYLTNEKKLSPGSILIAVSALRFLYKVTLHRDWCFEDIIPAPKKPQTLPIVLSPGLGIRQRRRAFWHASSMVHLPIWLSTLSPGKSHRLGLSTRHQSRRICSNF